jgi:hypothetical protein
MTFDKRKDQKRQPRDQGYHHNPAMQQFQGFAGKISPAVEFI